MSAYVGWTIKKCIFGLFFVSKFPVPPLERNFDVFVVFPFLSWIDQYTIRANRSNGWKVIQVVLFHENSTTATLKWNPENFSSFYVFQLVELNRSVNCLWESAHWLKSYFGGHYSLKFPSCSPSVKFETFFIIPHFSACEPESIGRMGEKLLLGVFLHENSALAPLKWNYEFDGFIMCPLLKWIISIQFVTIGRMAEKLFKGVALMKIPPVTPLKWIFQVFICFPLVALNWSLYPQTR